ncbi:MAG: baseplate protein [Crocinitomicaceae bacterium]|nr:baseplate protein [Crocinitomicaceae bacterium]|tara:strand:- start:1279 stop:2007 length:729 start_codon:yes stop_codon:yes gene_type:complete
MPLPKINTPTYELTLPSNRKKVKYRPFLVREEKILVLALESEDQKQITDAIIQIIGDCLITKNIDVTKLPTFDIEYLFLNVRSKSVGETVEVNVTCPDDGKTKVETSINIDDIKVIKNKDHNLIVKLDDKYSMKLKYPSLDQFVENNFDFEMAAPNESVSAAMSMLSSCIDLIYDEEESWDASESTKEELDEFIDQLNTKQFQKVEEFFRTMPKLSHTLKVTNPQTGVESEVVLEGLASFFS